jgi:hypothetical protein
MRRFPLALLLLGLLASPLMDARGAFPGDSTRPPGVSTKGINLAGRVSDDGKTLLAEDDNTWNVNNADMLHGLEGRYVTLKCRMDLSKRAILVLYVFPPDTKRSPNLRDSAFRR